MANQNLHPVISLNTQGLFFYKVAYSRYDVISEMFWTEYARTGTSFRSKRESFLILCFRREMSVNCKLHTIVGLHVEKYEFSFVTILGFWNLSILVVLR
jgi:hypothetical protein